MLKPSAPNGDVGFVLPVNPPTPYGFPFILVSLQSPHPYPFCPAACARFWPQATGMDQITSIIPISA